MKRLALIFVLALGGCFTGSDEAANALEAHGFVGVRFGGTAFWACGKGDKIGLRFTGTNQAGRRVSGTVCCGNFKGCTVRF